MAYGMPGMKLKPLCKQMFPSALPISKRNTYALSLFPISATTVGSPLLHFLCFPSPQLAMSFCHQHVTLGYYNAALSPSSSQHPYVLRHVNPPSLAHNPLAPGPPRDEAAAAGLGDSGQPPGRVASVPGRPRGLSCRTGPKTDGRRRRAMAL